ncbi:unnamed protein product [Caenorhabditis angaria]|uniref:RNA polymerase II-associated factor 1 homolog n=1 Tax=Caenorhabditis angaria TaxID=860376 RepID=A0A9P1N8L4_9PELO|nr:unnamed protein product [Caenorhabditis angaria]
MIRSLSGSPLFADMISPESKFVGEALEMRDVRTIFVGAKEDEKKRDNRVTLFLGPSGAEKSELIDFLCNYFYGIDPNRGFRHHIANEKFNAQTPDRPVQCYIFNNTVLPIRPILIDTPGCGDELITYNIPELINRWLLENWKMRIDTIAVVFSDLHRTTSKEEDELQKVLTELPHHVRENIVVFITASDGSRPFEPLLRRFGLSQCPKYTIHTSCLFQKPMEDRLNDEHRRRYWNMSVNQFKSYYDGLKESTPVTISGLPYIDDAIYGASHESGQSSRSSMYSAGQSTIVEVITSNKKLPPVPPPKPKFTPIPPRPPPIPTSPIPPPIQIPKSKTNAEGIPLSPEPIQTKNSTPPPPNFAPPKPPKPQHYETANNSKNTTITTQALTNAMNEQLRQQRTSHYEITESSRLRNDANQHHVEMRQNPNRASYIESRRHSVPDDIRHYADESTPPPVVHDIADRYSTVAYMNHDPYVQTIRTNSPTRNIAVRDAHRLSRENIQIIENTINSSPTDSQSEELRRMYSGRSANSVKPTGDISTRYVYDVNQRSYTSQDHRTSAYVPTHIEKRRWSKSSEPRSETYINDPYYTGSDVVTGYGVIETRNSRTSLHTLTGGAPELVHSENKYDYQQIAPGTHIARDDQQRFSRQDQARRSRHQSEGSRQIHIERRISPERQRKDRLSGDYTHINMQDNPQYRAYPGNPPLPPKQTTQPITRHINGGEVYEDHRTYETYTQINHQNRNGTNSRQQHYPQKYDQVPEDQQNTNHYIIPKSMRGSGSPIQNVPQQQSQHYGQYDAYGQPIYEHHGAAPYGVTEETTTTTTTTRKEEIERKRRKKEEEDRRRKHEEELKRRNENGAGNSDRRESHGQQGQNHDYGYGDYRDAEQGLLEEEYNTRHMKRTVEYPNKNKYRENLDDYGRRIEYPNRNENGRNSNQNQNGNQRGRNEGKGRTVQRTTNSKLTWSGWSPSNYSNPRDCFLNVLCFIIAPIIIISIIIVIIVFVLINSTS